MAQDVFDLVYGNEGSSSPARDAVAEVYGDPRMARAMSARGVPRDSGIPGMEEISSALLEQGDMGKERLPFRDRYALGAFDTPSEKAKAFQEMYPEGSLVTVPGDSARRLYFRTDPSKPYSPVNPSGLDFGDVGGVLGQESGTLAGEIAGGLFSRSPAGMVAKSALGAMAGELGQEAVEKYGVGISDEEWGDVGARALGKGAVAAGGAAVGELAGAALRGARGGGFLSPAPGASQAAEAGARIDAPRLTIGQYSESPIPARLESQAKGVTGAVEEAYLGQQEALTGALRGLVTRPRLADTPKALLAASKRMRDDVLRRIKRPGARFADASGALRKGFRAWNEKHRALVDQLYRNARAIEEPQFDISDLQVEARRLLEGTVGQTEPRPVPTGLVDASGNPVTELRPEKVTVHEPKASLRDVLRKIAALDPSVPPTPKETGGISSSTDQLEGLSRELMDLARPSPGMAVPQNDSALANRIRQRIKAVMDNPVNPTSSPEFRDAWKAARAAAQHRFETMERGLVVDMLRTGTPEKVARELLQPGRVEDIRLARAVLPTKKFQKVQDAFKADLIGENGSMARQINARLDQMARDGSLELLLSPAEQQSYRALGRAMEEVERFDLDRLVFQQRKASTAIKAILSSAKPIDAFNLVGALKKGSKSDRKAVQAAIYDHLFETSTVQGKAGLAVDHGRLRAAMDRLDELGLSDIMSRNHRQIVNDVETYARFIKERSEVGASLVAAGRVSSSFEELLRGNLVGPLFELGHLVGFGRLLMSDKARKFMTARKLIPRSRLPGMVGAAALQTISPE